jgi:hypothetical protein
LELANLLKLKDLLEKEEEDPAIQSLIDRLAAASCMVPEAFPKPITELESPTEIQQTEIQQEEIQHAQLVHNESLVDEWIEVSFHSFTLKEGCFSIVGIGRIGCCSRFSKSTH